MDSDGSNEFVGPILPTAGPANVAQLIRVDDSYRKKSAKTKHTTGSIPNELPRAPNPLTRAPEAAEPSREVLVKSTRPVIIDVGTGYLKAGFAGDEAPSCVIPSVVGVTRPGGRSGCNNKRGFVGSELPGHQPDLLHVRPVHNGIITEWDAMETLWEHAYRALGVPSEEHAVLLSDPPLSPTTNREKLAEVMFERFSSPAMYIENQAVLSMYSYGRTSGLVVASGQGHSYVVPVADGCYLPVYTCRMEYGGRSLDLHLHKLLTAAGKSVPCDRFDDIKATCCYVAADVEKELSRIQSDVMEYKLPDGRCVSLEKERFLCPEALFQPGLLGSRQPGLHIAVMNCLNRCDIKLKSDILQNILVCGGCTMFRGFAERLQSELDVMMPGGGATVMASPERRNAVWVGGSILASLSSFQALWMQRKDYEEKGVSGVYRHCF